MKIGAATQVHAGHLQSVVAPPFVHCTQANNEIEARDNQRRLKRGKTHKSGQRGQQTQAECVGAHRLNRLMQQHVKYHHHQGGKNAHDRNGHDQGLIRFRQGEIHRCAEQRQECNI